MSSESDTDTNLSTRLSDCRSILDSIEWTSDTRSPLQTLVVAAHGLRPLLRLNAFLALLLSPQPMIDKEVRGELAQDTEYAREHVHRALAYETDPAVGMAHLHVAEALLRHAIDVLDQDHR